MLGYIQPTWTEREFCYLSQLAFGDYARRTGTQVDVAAKLRARFTLDLDELDALNNKLSTGVAAIVGRLEAAA